MQDEHYELLQAIASDLAQQIAMRALVLERIGALQPVGRRQLSAKLNKPEREIRTVSALLKEQDLISLDAAGMSLTAKGSRILPAAQQLSRELRGLTDLELQLASALPVDKVCVVSGGFDPEDGSVGEVGKCAAQRLRTYLHSGCTLAVTGGTTTHAVADAVQPGTPMDVTVVPARGAMESTIDNESNVVASDLAKRLGGKLRLMFVPDQMDEGALHEMRKLRDVEETLTILAGADVILHGIGRADVMAGKRHLHSDVAEELTRSGAVGESLGEYFNLQGKTVYTAKTVLRDLGALNPNGTLIAVAAGAQKAQAIIGAMRSRRHALLVIDEGAAREVLRVIGTEQNACTPQGALQ